MGSFNKSNCAKTVFKIQQMYKIIKSYQINQSLLDQKILNKVVYYSTHYNSTNTLTLLYFYKIVDISSIYGTLPTQTVNTFYRGVNLLLHSNTILSVIKTYKSAGDFYLNGGYKSLVMFNTQNLNKPKFSNSSMYKNVQFFNDFEFMFLRKNKVFNKGRYSRCRQNYRTGVYLCMYLSVVSIFGLYYWFLKFSFSFTYLWWVFISFVGSFFLPKIIKYRLYEPTTLLQKCFGVVKWSFAVIKTIIRGIV